MMEVDKDLCIKLLKVNCKAIIHMRQEIGYDRFGLILGAGSVLELGFPKWGELIEGIAKHKDVNALDLLENTKKSNTSLSQLLFYRFKENQKKLAENRNKIDTYRFETEVKANWLKIVHSVLYNDVPEDLDALKKKDKYLQHYIEVIKKSKVTVNYNFDDTIEQLVRDSLTETEKDKTRGYKTSWSANMKLYPKSNVIYHPNGFLPRKITEYPSPDVVFLEDSFEDQLIDSMSGHYSFLLNHLAQNTCLLLGLSLNDPTLKNLLRQNATGHPGHHHYYVAYVKSNEEMDEQLQKSIIASNFEVYNLITLFLTNEEIAALGYLLSISKDSFKTLILKHRREDLQNAYRYYITGPVGVGKTTMIHQFLSFDTVGEWFDPLPEGMEKDPSMVSDQNEKKIDKWVAEQVYLKNVELNSSETGIHIIDRCPLDAFAYTEADKWVEKAQLLNSTIKINTYQNILLVPGHIILLTGDPEVIAIRAKMNFRETKAENLKEQQEKLLSVYGKREKRVTVIDTREKNIRQVAKAIAWIVYCTKYDPAPIQKWLDMIEKGEISEEIFSDSTLL